MIEVMTEEDYRKVRDEVESMLDEIDVWENKENKLNDMEMKENKKEADADIRDINDTIDRVERSMDRASSAIDDLNSDSKRLKQMNIQRNKGGFFSRMFGKK